MKRSAPKFLLDIYKNALGEDEEEKPLARSHKAGEFDLSGQDLRAIDQSDVIMTFAAHSKFEFLKSFDRCLLKNKGAVTLNLNNFDWSIPLHYFSEISFFRSSNKDCNKDVIISNEINRFTDQ